jgi:hypothetical protein
MPFTNETLQSWKCPGRKGRICCLRILIRRSKMARSACRGSHVQTVKGRQRDSGALITSGRLRNFWVWKDPRWENGKHCCNIAKYNLANVSHYNRSQEFKNVESALHHAKDLLRLNNYGNITGITRWKATSSM